MTFQEMFDACTKAAERSVEGPYAIWGIDRETYAMWKASAGNAKARRRWRRREIPNSQRVKP